MTTLIAHLCGWCPKAFNPPRLVNGVISHGLCPTCQAKLHAELDAAEASRVA